MRVAIASLVIAAVLAAAGPAAAQLPLLGGGGGGGGGDGLPAGPRYSNPVLPGDYPDPSVLRDGSDYWAVTTSGGWRPAFTMLASRDLVNWVVAGSVLRKPPAWAQGDFWAPEIIKRGRSYLVYYAARSGRRRCVGVASASRPTAFFRDRGRVVCSSLGAIDPLPVYDEAGRFFLVWKEDGNSRGRPTPIMAAPLRPDGLRLAGSKRELFRADQPWETGVVEGPAMTRHDGRLYMFYSAGYCCGPSCNYAMGVARSSSLMGPWEKHPGPILQSGPAFRCPGHSSAVVGPDHADYLLYHAYSADPLSPGRQVLLDRVVWDADGWPVVATGVPSAHASSPLGAQQQPRPQLFTDDFRGRFLTAGWNWTSTHRPVMHVSGRRGGRLWLSPPRGEKEAVVARQPGVATWVAEADVGSRRHGVPGIGAFADGAHALGLEVRGGRAVAWRREGSTILTLGSVPIGRPRFVTLRVTAEPGVQYSFEVRTGGGWTRVAGPYPAPAWPAETRVMLHVGGGRRARAAFERFSLGPLRP